MNVFFPVATDLAHVSLQYRGRLATFRLGVCIKDMKVLKSLLLLLLLAPLCPAPPAWAEDYDEAPIRYSDTVADDAVARLFKRVAAGEVTLAYHDEHGWLPSLLEHLRIPLSSQTLVFSKTSLQRERIAPDRPRALYFNDEVYVGMVQHGDVLEISATDPRQGTMFYVLPTRRAPVPAMQRQTHECLQCHDSNAFTGGVPGLVMRSVYPDADGRPVLTAGSFVTDQRSPLANRWGGWYVTGTTGDLLHLGNQVFSQQITPETVDRRPGSGRVSLADLIDVQPYLTPHSDVVALLVLGHQLQMHNLLTRASYEGRRAARDDQVMNEALGRPADFRSDTTKRRIASVGEALLRYLLYADEAPLSGPVRGTTTFAADFQAQGPRDAQGRSLRDLDLERRLLKHPLSHLIYSESFDALPQPVHAYVLERLLAVLTTNGTDDQFSHLSRTDRRAILEILVATKPGLPPAFAAAVGR